ncbi:MAG: FAD-dependent oxidoreductase [Firmicutes bacterium]|nr:FAD-dependent oxidoreductase [Bacillota bacterium]
MVESYSGNKFNCDVLIVGGGVAGCAAAIVAARRGQRVLLLEKDYALGGIATSGYVTGIAGCVEGMSKEWFERMVELGWGRKLPNDLKHCVFDPSKAKMMLERMICEQGGRVLYGTYVIDAEVEDKQIKKVICQSVSGRFEISAKVYIDASGDAVLSVAAGVPYAVGSPEFQGLNLSTTLAFRMAHVNFTKWTKYRAEWTKEEHKKPLKEQDWNPVQANMDLAVKNGDLPYFVFPAAIFNPVPGFPLDNCDLIVMAAHSYFTHTTDVEDITRQIVEQHQQILDFEKFYRKYLPGFENSMVTEIAPLLGIRDSRRVIGKTIFKASDIAFGTKFEDGIARFPEMFDTHHPTSPRLGFKRHIHVPKAEGSAVDIQSDMMCNGDMHPFGMPAGIQVRPNPKDHCDIPFGALQPLNCDNLFVAGRCISAEFDAVGGVRVIAPAMSTGQAAAVAADYCIKNNILPTDVDGKIIHKLMIEEEKVPLDKLPDGHWEMMRGIEGEFVVDRSDSVHIIGKDGTFYR